MSFFEKFLDVFARYYPQTHRALDLGAQFSPLLICPNSIRLPSSLRTQAEQIVRAFFSLRQVSSRAQELSSRPPAVFDPGNTSVLMSYDFHVDGNSQLRLIEINTNASMSLAAELNHEVQEIPNPFSACFRTEIIDCFIREYREAVGTQTAIPQRIAIVDENPTEQRMFFEFEMYRELFTQRGFATHILGPQELSFQNGLRYGEEQIDLVYNRLTDFYFETPGSSALKNVLQNTRPSQNTVCISPHPHEYRLLADKERLLELSAPGAIAGLPLSEEEKAALNATLIRTIDIGEFSSADELWADRKRWFFKTKHSFGGKAAYRGSSISRSMFAEVIKGPYLAQEFVPAPLTRVGSDEFKYDLRFFVYRDKIQLACARLYQGQMTNSSTPGGGITPIEWV